MTYQAASGPVEALAGISASIGAGEFVSLVGPSGCGKSTLLRIVAGLRPATRGTITVAGRTVTQPIPGALSVRQDDGQVIVMVFQAPILLKWRSILENVLLPAELAGKDPAKFRTRAGQLLEMAGLAGFGPKLPRELSGGMQQRAALCRALLLDPPLLLMDEPFGALDAMTRDDMALELLRIWGEKDLAREARKTVLFVTHSIPEAVFLSDRVIVMSARPGRIAADLRIDLPRPRTVELRATEAFGKLNLELFRALTGKTGAGTTL